MYCIDFEAKYIQHCTTCIKSQNCMMVIYRWHSTPSPLSLPSSADNGHATDVKMVIMWTF